MNSDFVIGEGPRQSLMQLPMWPATHFPKPPKYLSISRGVRIHGETSSAHHVSGNGTAG